MTRRRDLNNLRKRDAYLPHSPDDGCDECQQMNRWLDAELERLAGDCE